MKKNPTNAYEEWLTSAPNVFVSKVYFSIPLFNGAGIYFMNAYKYRLLPRFYFSKASSHIECGINFAGWICEFMWNKAFEVNEKRD